MDFMFKVIHIPTAKFVLTDDGKIVRHFYGTLPAKELLRDSRSFIETEDGILLSPHRLLSFEELHQYHFSIVPRGIDV